MKVVEAAGSQVHESVYAAIQHLYTQGFKAGVGKCSDPPGLCVCLDNAIVLYLHLNNIPNISLRVLEDLRTKRSIYYRKYILQIKQPSQYRYTQSQYRFAVISEAPSTWGLNAN